MHKVKYGLFYDNHTHFDNPDVGKDFDAEYFTDQLKRCGADYLGFHARCNQGMAYYDTKIGIKHPALTYDLFGQLTEACARKGIAVAAYLNGGISNMEAVAHPEWRTVYMPGLGHFGKVTPYAYTMCYNSGYRDHLLAMIREIAGNYPVQGFFIDCLQSYPCVCNTCVTKMKELGTDWTKKEEVVEFSRKSAVNLCRDIAATVKSVIPDPMLYFNGPAFGTVRDLDTFYDCECLPTAGWGYEFLPTMAHYIRNITPGKQILNMTGRFYDWGDFGGLRGAESLEFDMFYGLSHGMRPNIAGHFHPRGDKDLAVFDRISEVYSKLRVYDDWHIGAENLTDVAIVYPEDRHEMRYTKSVTSAVRMLDELKVQFDIVLADCDKEWDQYKLLVLPEDIVISDRMKERIKKHMAAGKAFFACGKNAAEAFGDELGIVCEGDLDETTVYFALSGAMSKNIEDMPHSLYANATKASLKDAEFVAPLIKAYCKKEWNGVYAQFYIPPDKVTDIPFLTKKQNRIWCSGDLFSGYYYRGALHLRELLKNCINELASPLLLENISLPGFVRTTVAQQPGRINVNLVAYAPERRGDATVVEDAMAVMDGKFRLNLPGKKVKAVTLAPTGAAVDYTINGDTIEITVPVFKGFALISLEVGQ
ncbi:MAG: alpha-L-fucosidase [Lentisphaeria bacterium]|nr:alpha-L-fucosidase [Lentisphaeria bacterium]